MVTVHPLWVMVLVGLGLSGASHVPEKSVHDACVKFHVQRFDQDICFVVPDPDNLPVNVVPPKSTLTTPLPAETLPLAGLHD